MAFEHFIRYGNKKLRCGYTTGSCAALAAKAAVQWMLTGECPETVSLMTVRGIPVEAEVLSPERNGEAYSCAIRKDGGDDPDATDGMLIFARVRKLTDLRQEKPGNSGAENRRPPESGPVQEESDPKKPFINIDGGEGIGRVTKPGLDQPVGAAAINTMPRRMIEENVREVCEAAGYEGGVEVTVYAPEGEKVAAKTFNAMMGILGGISILGTTGIVDPMSEKAMVDVIETEAHQARSLTDRVILIPGNYGEDYLKAEGLLFENIPVIKYSGFFGEALDITAMEGFREVLIVSHVGKLVKTAGGIMNTHQRVADCRTELFTAHAAVCGADTALCRELMNAATTDACIELLDGAGLREPVLESLLTAIEGYIARRLGGEIRWGAVMFSNVYGTLGMTEGTEAVLKEWRKKQ